MKYLLFLFLFALPAAYAETGYDYFNILNPDGTYTWKSHDPYVFDGENYVPFIKTNNQVETAADIVIQNSDGSYSWVQKGITDKIVAKYADQSDLTSWTYLTSLNNVTPTNTWNGTAFISEKQNALGKLKYTYTLQGLDWKTELEATNLTALTTKIFGFDEILDLNTDTVMFGGVERNLDNFHGQTFNKAWLDANKGRVLNFLNGIAFDFDKGYENLYAITVIDTGANKSRLVFDYRMSAPLLPGQTITIDPTFGYDATGKALYLYNTAATGTSCDVAPYTKSYPGGFNQIERGNSGLSQTCSVGGQQWNVTSITGAGKIVTDVKVRYDISATVGGGLPCDWTPVTNEFSATAAATLWTDILDGTPYVTSDTNCQTVANNYIIDLGTSADTSVQTALDSSQTWWNVGIKYTDMTRTAVRYVTGFTSDASTELEITYSVTCTAPTLNTVVSKNSTGIELSWTPPSPACSVSNYKVYESASGGDYTLKSTLGNVTSTNYNTLDSATLYAYKVSAGSSLGYGTNSSSISNATTPDAPINLTSTPVTKTSLDTTYDENSTGSYIQWFKSRYADCSGGAWVNFNTNSSVNTPRYENFTGLTESVQYCIQIASGNIGGFGDWSANGTGRTITTTSGTVTMTPSQLGDMFNGTALVTITTASPSPVTVSQIDVVQNGTIVASQIVSQSIAEGGSYSFDDNFFQILDGDPHSYQLQAIVTNNTGTLPLISSSQDLTREYAPTYIPALDPTQGLVNYTVTRSADQSTIVIDMNRDFSGATFQTECLYRTMTEASLNSGGTWHNYTGIGYMIDQFDDAGGNHYYIDCYNDGLLFSSISYTNSSMLLAGIQVFDSTYGTFIGVPVGVFFIVLVAGMANQRTAPMWIVVILAIAGIMSAIGFFTLETNVWALALIAALLGIVVGRKLF